LNVYILGYHEPSLCGVPVI